ncbi:MAG: putative methyltransferase [Prokaryotic dsDNA virus sp.]|nr:MAG: putative methyltransferase [Prokaryotic dsDNA virus sp.]|tara:strand:+ start:6163 stop:6765 length:603 start_codon:yes stop_codon:yes gene_type:complete
MIKSVYENQIDILKSIMTLCNIKRFDVDVTYGNGMFYKEIEKPLYCFDIDPSLVETPASSDNLPLADNSVSSLIFDPPFLTYVRAARKGNGNMVMAKRFGGYWRYDELEAHYKDTLKEAARVLIKKGIMIFKCQDIIHNHKMHCTHVNVINWAAGEFRIKDLFILPAKTRMAIPQQVGTKKKVQKHARIFHSYFLVLERL